MNARRKISAAALAAAVFETRDNELATRQVGGRLEIKGVDEAGVFEGHGSVFNVEDSYGDVVMPGAFKRTLEEHRAAGTLPALLWQHRSDQPIGYYTEMTEDGAGLYVKGQLILDIPQARTAHKLLQAKAIRGLSIGFVNRESTEDHATGQRKVKDVDLWEVSLVTFPANRSATVESVKGSGGIKTLRDLEKFLRDAGKSRAEAVAIIADVRASILDGRDATDGPAIKTAMSAADRLLAALEK